MTDSIFDWSDDEKERLETLQSGDARKVANVENQPPDVTKERCSVWREWVASGKYRPHEIPAERALKTVERHVKGECRHSPSRVGLACAYSDERGWHREGVVSDQYVNREHAVVHLRECRSYPENPVPVSELSHPSVEVGVCRFCKPGRIPEAGPVPEASGDD